MGTIFFSGCNMYHHVYFSWREVLYSSFVLFSFSSSRSVTSAAEDRKYIPLAFSDLPYYLLLSEGPINMRGPILSLCSTILFRYQ